MGRTVRQQAERLYATFSELVRSYQYRDRGSICCHGISVTQCHVLDALQVTGALTMGELARRLLLDVSTMTRTVDPLVAQGLVQRTQSEQDRRVWFVSNTAAGTRLMKRIQQGLVDEHEAILRALPAGSRQDVIRAVEGLLEAFRARQQDAAACDP